MVAFAFFVSAALASEGLSKDLHAVERLQEVPAGLTLPVDMQKGCEAGKCPVGTEVVAVTTQRVPLNAAEYLPRGAEVHGTVVRSEDTRKGAARSAWLAIRFDSLRLHGRRVPLRATAIAAANLVAVSDSAAPVNGIADRSLGGQANWTTQQVGGDVITRSGWTGDLSNTAMQPVGFADFHGVYATPAVPGAVPHALGVFSADAHGLYGYDDGARLETVIGTISLHCSCRLVLRRGDNVLLRVEK